MGKDDGAQFVAVFQAIEQAALVVAEAIGDLEWADAVATELWMAAQEIALLAEVQT